MPAIAQMMAEETPRMLIIFVRHQDAYSSPIDVRARSHVLLPDDTEKERAGAGHDGYVGKSPVSVVFLERLNDKEEEGVTGHGAHSVVRDARRIGFSCPGGVGQEGIETALAALKRSAKWWIWGKWI